GAQPPDCDPQVEAVEQRAGDAAPVSVDVCRRAAACLDPVAGVSTRAGVGGGHQLDTGGERHRQPPAGDDYLAFFEGLAEGVERPGGELAELVEEEDPVCGEGDLS